MVISIFLMMIVIVGKVINGYAQEKQERNVVYVNILPLIVGYLNIHYEFAVTNKVSLLAGLGYSRGILGFELEDREISNIAIKFGLGFYPAGKPLSGVYVLPNIILSYFNSTYKPTSEKEYTRKQKITVEFGHRWIGKSGVMFDLSMGAGVVSGFKVREGNQREKLPKRIGLTHCGVQFGYVW